jgi:hypothetical protein
MIGGFGCEVRSKRVAPPICREKPKTTEFDTAIAVNLAEIPYGR